MKLVELNEKFNKKLDEIKSSCREKLEEYKYLLKPFIIILIISLLAFYPIARANVNYEDDIGRVHSGYIEWDFFSRFVSKYLAIFIHTGTYLADISPLPQILAIILLSITGSIVISLFNDNKKISLINILAVLPIGLSPFYLECISFKYDAPYMALSIFASVLPFVFYKKNEKSCTKFFIANVIGALVMCMTYQASSGIVPMITIFLAFNLWSNKEAKEALKLIGVSALSYLLGLIIFKVFILVPAEYYASTEMFSIKDLIPGFIGNLKTYYQVADYTLRKLWKILILAIIALYVINKTIESKQNKIISFFMATLVVVASGIVTFGALPALEHTTFVPRNMFGIGVLIALMSVNMTANRKCILNSFVVFLLFWCFFTFSFLFGNALAEQKRYETFRIQTVIDALNDLEIMNNDETKTINIRGNVGRAPSIENYPKGYQNMIEYLMTQIFGGDAYFGRVYFRDYFKLRNVNVVSDGSEADVKFDYVEDTMYYQIWTNSKDYIFLVLE